MLSMVSSLVPATLPISPTIDHVRVQRTGGHLDGVGHRTAPPVDHVSALERDDAMLSETALTRKRTTLEVVDPGISRSAECGRRASGQSESESGACRHEGLAHDFLRARCIFPHVPTETCLDIL